MLGADVVVQQAVGFLVGQAMKASKGRGDAALIGELMAFATQPRFVFAHKWRVGDVLIWDNLATMHRATPFDDRAFKRDMRRTTCRERAVNVGASRIA